MTQGESFVSKLDSEGMLKLARLSYEYIPKLSTKLYVFSNAMGFINAVRVIY